MRTAKRHSAHHVCTATPHATRTYASDAHSTHTRATKQAAPFRETCLSAHASPPARRDQRVYASHLGPVESNECTWKYKQMPPEMVPASCVAGVSARAYGAHALLRCRVLHDTHFRPAARVPARPRNARLVRPSLSGFCPQRSNRATTASQRSRHPCAPHARLVALALAPAAAIATATHAAAHRGGTIAAAPALAAVAAAHRWAAEVATAAVPVKAHRAKQRDGRRDEGQEWKNELDMQT